MKTEIEVKKNCDNCIKNSSCKFLAKYNEMAKSNMMYEMFEYLEWNNLDKLFKDNASKCKHYRQEFPNGKLILSLVGRDIFYKAVKIFVGDNLKATQYGDSGYKILTRDGTEIDNSIIEETFTVKIVNELSKVE